MGGVLFFPHTKMLFAKNQIEAGRNGRIEAGGGGDE
jgi:hypothetical protein